MSGHSSSLGNSNVRVVVRVRPENEKEVGSSAIVQCIGDNVLVFDPKQDNEPRFRQGRKGPILKRKPKDLQFAFDRVFGCTASQDDVFQYTTRDVISSVLNGVNCSVFAYGATGAGKTHTMLGSQEQPGIMFLTMMELYRKIYEQQDTILCDVAVSYLEVYNEQIRDLLVPSGPLPVRDNGGELVVNGLSLHKPHNAEELLGMLSHGNLNRSQHPTEANATSSRSHAVFQVRIHQKPRTASMHTQVTTAKLSLIDLAGSERATVTQNKGARMREGANINRSLLALGNCINALACNKPKNFVPYRDSKLTRLLKDSLGGSCQTVMITNVSPSGLTFEDTYNSLRYADRAKQIKAKLVRNVVNVNYHVSRYKAIVDDLHKEIAELKDRLEKGGGKSCSSSSAAAFDKAEAARLQGAVAAVYGERCSLRRKMAELELAERQLLSRIKSKDVLVRRLEYLKDTSDRRSRLEVKRGQQEAQLRAVREEARGLHGRLDANQEDIAQTQREVASSSAAQPDPFLLRQYMEVVVERERERVEGQHCWTQVKGLSRYISTQERGALRRERLIGSLLQFVHKVRPLLSSPVLCSEYEALMRSSLCEKGVVWADEDTGEGGNSTATATSLECSFASFTSSHLNTTATVSSSPPTLPSLPSIATATTVQQPAAMATSLRQQQQQQQQQQPSSTTVPRPVPSPPHSSFLSSSAVGVSGTSRGTAPLALGRATATGGDDNDVTLFSSPAASTATAGPSMHAAITPVVLGTPRMGVTTPTVSSIPRPLSSVGTQGRTIRRVKILPPPPKIPTFEEAMRQRNTPGRRTAPAAATPCSSGPSHHSLLYSGGGEGSVNRHHQPRSLAGSGRSPFVVPRLAFDDNFASPRAPSPSPSSLRRHSASLPSPSTSPYSLDRDLQETTTCNETFVVTSPLSTQDSSLLPAGGVSVSHDSRGRVSGSHDSRGGVSRSHVTGGGVSKSRDLLQQRSRTFSALENVTNHQTTSTSGRSTRLDQGKPLGRGKAPPSYLSMTKSASIKRQHHPASSLTAGQPPKRSKENVQRRRVRIG